MPVYKLHLPIWSQFVLTVILSTLAAIVGYLALEIFFPSLPAIAKDFGVSQAVAQLTVAVYLTSFGFSQLIYGPLSDYKGRRPMVLIGLCLYFLGSIVCLKASSFAELIVGRFLQGLGAGASASLSRVILRDLSSGNKMAQLGSILSTIIATATAVSPGVGGLLQGWYGYQANFVVMLGFGLLVLSLMGLFLPETNKNKLTEGVRLSLVLRSAAEIMRNRNFLRYVAYAGLALAVLVASASINPFLLQNKYGLSPAHYGLLAIIIALGEMVGALINAWLVISLGLDRMLQLGFIIIMLTGLGLILPLSLSPVSQIVGLCFLAALGTAFIFPSASAGGFSAFVSNIGLVGALYGFIQILVCSICSYSISLLQLDSQRDLGLFFVVAAAVGAGLSCLNHRQL